jgi:hypothetical protein
LRENSNSKIKKIVIVKLKILNKKREKQSQYQKSSQFSESSGLIPLVSNPDIGAYDCWFLGVPVSSQGWYSGLYKKGCCSFCQTPWCGELTGFFFLLSLV